MKIQLRKGPRQPVEQIEVKSGTTIEEIYQSVKEELPYKVLAANVDNKVEELSKKLTRSCSVELLDMRTQVANLIYEHSLSLIYLKSVEDVLGRVDTEILHALNKGLFTIIHKEGGVTEEEVAAIEARMHELVDADLPFVKEVVSREEALASLDDLLLQDKKRLLEKSRNKKVRYFSLEGFKNFFYGEMVPSTGYIDLFELRKYREGVLVRYPHTSDPSILQPYVDDVKLYEAFKETNRWQDILGIDSVIDLNECIEKGRMPEVIQLSEALHEKRIVEIAREITDQGKRIILIAGPSSSGKTSFAHRLCIQLAVNGARPLYLGTDDYFVERDETPLDAHGEPDYENLSAIDIGLFNRDMNGLLAGDTVDLPTFDFMEGRKIFGKRMTRIDKEQTIVIEGIHALNGELTKEIPDEEKYKIYISPLTQLCIDKHNRIPTTDARMIRRMVRDYKYRNHSAQETIREWPKVRAGEDKNIFPYNGEADAFFNSVHIYELSVLKKYASPLLEAITQDEPEYLEAHRLLRFLNFFQVYEDEDVIVNNSILREFIGGSIFFR